MNTSIQTLLVLFSLFYAGTAAALTCQNNIPPSNPASAYSDHANGTVTDLRTGLMWKTCSEGQTYSAGSCSGTATTHNWSAALALAESTEYAGEGDWRLPTIQELQSLVELCRVNPSINHTIFPNTPSSVVWSGSPHSYDSGFAWYVYFLDGHANFNVRSSSLHVRLVRGGQSFAAFEGDASVVQTGSTTFLSENLPDGTFTLGEATKRWRFKTADTALTGVKAVRLTNDAALGIQQSEIAVGDIAANSEFVLTLPLNVVRGSGAIARSEWKLVDGEGKDIAISNSASNTFWLALRTNRPPTFSPLQSGAIGGAVGATLTMPLVAEDPDGDALSFSVIEGGGSIVNGNWQGSVASAGVHTITVQVSDGIETSRTRFDIVAYDPAGISHFFADVPYPGTADSNSVYSTVHYLALNGIVMGTRSDNNERYYEPNRAIYQAEALKMLLLASQQRGWHTLMAAPYIPEHYQLINPQTGYLENFGWAAHYAYTAQQLGLIADFNQFNPAATLSRETLALWLDKLLNQPVPVVLLQLNNLLDKYRFTDEASFSSPHHYEAALANAFWGYLGRFEQAFNPGSVISRGDTAVVVAKLLRTPQISDIAGPGITRAERFGANHPVVVHGQPIQVNSVSGLTAPELNQQGALIKAEWLSPAQDYVKLGLTLHDGRSFGTSRLVKQLPGSPLSFNSDLIALNRSSLISVIALMENSRAGVRHAQYLPLALDFADRDGDGVRDDVDAFADDDRYSLDDDNNGVPDEIEQLLAALGIDGSQAATVNGVAQNYSLAYAVAFGLAYDSSMLGGGGESFTITGVAGQGGSISPQQLTVLFGDTAEFSITPDRGYRIVRVTGCNGTLNYQRYQTGIINQSCLIEAEFEQRSSRKRNKLLIIIGAMQGANN
ncbi:DUF1566 domain-containing protein [Rheinheimera baltica]|uniref:DUF1566 domain-containing protein n=1 Tax=Rheinheimera baltica TaxID=67576 RepID=A0ABT9I1S4_9GAMM|nr:DUF1566 domain-containing protein [Rheinheimera baltica]MDP5137335.1 DUF1566 domain-containing protein [Rheinheimera baltica]